MTAGRILPALLIAALAAACSDSSALATGPRTTTNSAMAASAPLLGATADGAALDPGCASMVGTFYGQYTGAWVGTAYISIAGGTVETATFQDDGTGFWEHGARGGWSGTETNTITFTDAGGSVTGSFQVPASYNAQLTGTPELFVLHETGTLANGTGSYDGVSGHIALEGPFTFPDVGDVAPQWIGEMHGSICGLQ
jgi:hypothetical protein